ncbi:hypothetical protein SKAU_G00370230 [Synaphobranchus kaupii]|uniref:Uncharacterized protein n=1 Tax=Synaphobranchus kaupii TaxID=118154 RepID=A0A9Q1IFQ5_SYNKA|nr:hypothetical protein SKAU_G00370230 [Synaphobranchus kaupii]
MGRASGAYLVWMYQIQYNCTADETLVYRILPSTSDSFLLKNLVSGVDYSLCVLAIFDDAVTSLAATKVLGCAQFSTKDDYPECRSLQAHFLGGTLTIMVGGVIVVTLLVFTVTMMVRHRVCSVAGDGSDDGDEGGLPGSSSSSPLPAKGTNVYSQTNGSGGVMMVVVPNGILPQQRGGRARGRWRGTFETQAQNPPQAQSQPGCVQSRGRRLRPDRGRFGETAPSLHP